MIEVLKKHTVKDIMTSKVITVSPGDPILDVAKIIIDHNFNGVPVVDENNKLLGVITEYDLISKETGIHLPTFQTILKNLAVYKKDKSRFKKEVAQIVSLTAEKVMNPKPLTLSVNTSFQDVVKAFQDHHKVNPIPVVEKNNKLAGIVSRYDVLKSLSLLK
ncbi:MAG: hypothetical protein COT81_02815 [Candidatus Buchananbacteria bacterium CG10_big_fil_rev_8_21_14_0_10_42_9]|uniref:CBS domain-containing protein n=1 Tax=Candidatus Buchananbacteria bacterium CG10_big_fil_rev_8_21_14_0_10_42_9 TaxID=1974526 RepID=A0A2H0W3M1_9BACT|nr:MAG: hypothetical protein COT81_02815 [Candidatus Buchananbacteria bacterium CG10_big_fil_rev_8_21_14_0_10_42_9]